MAETILTPGKDNSSNTEQTPTINPGYLVKDNLLSEFETESEKSVARYNLGVLPAEDVYTKEEVEPLIAQRISKKLAEHLDSSDHITEEEILDMLVDLIKNDGTTPFTAPQAGVDPVSNHDLTTKAYVDRLIQSCLKLADRAKILEQVANTLRDYVKQEDVYTKDEVYTKDQIYNQSTKYVRIDGTTPFEKPQSGRTPQISSHLTTKGYVDNLLRAHEEDIDPHGFTEKLSKKLRKYALKENVYDRTQTYSRGQVDQIIDKLVAIAVEEALRSHEDLDDPHGILDRVKQLGYVHKDGSVAFTAPQRGVDAINPQDLATLRQLQQLVSEVKQDIANIPEPLWKTSGPVESTVGHVEDNTPVPDTMTLQEVCDAIFYGKGICLEVPEFVIITETCPITMCVHGSTGLIDYAQLLQNGKVIATFYGEDFKDGCVTIDSEPLFQDAEFTFRVYYTNEAVHEETKVVHCYLPIFVGLLPKWEFGNVITMERLIELSNEDIEGTQNRFLNYGKDLKTFTFGYKFQDADLRHPFVVLPESYPNLDSMTTSSQKFGTDAFDVIDMIPMRIPGVDQDTIYKMYIYKQALSSLNQDVTFNFIPKE